MCSGLSNASSAIAKCGPRAKNAAPVLSLPVLANRYLARKTIASA